MTLRPEHQQALLDFIYELSGIKKSHTSYAKDVLVLLAEHFHFENTMFFLTDAPDPVSIGSCLDWGDYESCRVLPGEQDASAAHTIQYLNTLYLCIQDKAAEQKLARMQRELLCRYNYITINQLPAECGDMELVKSSDLPEDPAAHPGLLEYMRTFRLSHYLLLRLYADDVLSGALYLFRTEEEGDFPQEDLILVHTLARYLSANYQDTLRYTNYVSKSQLLDCCSMRAPVGTIIIDSAFTILSVNHTGAEYCREIAEHGGAARPVSVEGTLYTPLGVSAQVDQVISSIREELDVINLTKSKRIDTVSASYEICVSSFLYATIYNQMQTYYFVYITKHTDYARASLDDLSKKYGLTSREIDIIFLLEQGYNNMDIGKSLCISCNTVKAHISSIFRKLNVSSRTALLHKIKNTKIRA